MSLPMKTWTYTTTHLSFNSVSAVRGEKGLTAQGQPCGTRSPLASWVLWEDFTPSLRVGGKEQIVMGKYVRTVSSWPKAEEQRTPPVEKLRDTDGWLKHPPNPLFLGKTETDNCRTQRVFDGEGGQVSVTPAKML